MDNISKLIFKIRGADKYPDGEVGTEKKKKRGKNIISILIRLRTMKLYFVEEAFKSHTALIVIILKCT